MSRKELRCVVVGDGTVGKTCLLMAHTKNKFQDDHVPTVLDEFSRVEVINGDRVVMTLWDTAGQEEFDRLRLLPYPRTSVFVLCFSLASEVSFANIKSKWYPEVTHHCPTALIVLVGTKLDLKLTESATNVFVTRKQGLLLQKQIKAHSFVECSAKTRVNVKKVFDKVQEAYCVQTNSKPKKKGCILL